MGVYVTASTAPWVQVAVPQIVHVEQSGGGDVVGPDGVEAGRPARFADASGKVIEAAPVNSPGGLVVLDGDGTIPDNRIPASIARDTEVTSAISAATAGMVIDTDPRLSDARTPLAHTHPATAVSTVPATTGLDPASTDVEKALTELAARPSGGGGGGIVVAAGERVQGVVATSLLPYSSATNPAALVYGALRAEFHRALHTGQTISSLQIEVTSTSLSLGQVVLVGCFAEHEGFAGVKLWEQAIVCDDTTGIKSASGLELAMPDGPCWIAFGNPNSATVTLRAIPSEPIFVRLGSTTPAIPHMAEFSGFPADMSDWKVTPTTTSTPLKLLGTHLASRAPLIGALT